jgi:photosystem II stability/assembly factor-like uncharacterized protein
MNQFKTILLGIALLSAAPAKAQWQSQVSNVTTDLMDVYFLNATTGWAVGTGGTLIQTTNGGSTWTSLNSGTTNPLTSVFFLNSSVGFMTGGIVGQFGPGNGFILRTTNGGTSWTTVLSNANASLNKVKFVTADTGYAVGGDTDPGVVYRTINGGTSWTLMYSFGSGPANFTDFHFFNGQKGIVVGNTQTNFTNFLGTTQDAGQSFTVGALPGSILVARSIHFTNANNGYIVGEGSGGYSVYRTTNGGSSWTQNSISANGLLNAIHFMNADTGFIVGASGQIYKTIHAGQSWTTNNANTTLGLNDVFCPAPGIAYAVGDAGTIRKYDAGNPQTGVSISNLVLPGQVLCSGSSYTVGFTTSGNFNAGNQLTAELSDASGNFPGTVVGSVVATSAGSISITIPSLVSPGTAYRLRIASSNPAFVSNPSAPFQIATTPAVPTITRSNDTLTATAAASYQWFFNGQPITGATSQKYKAVQGTGGYAVRVTNAAGCSATSAVFNYQPSSVAQWGAAQGWTVHPNPAKDQLVVTVPDGVQQLAVYSLSGQCVYRHEGQARVLQIATDRWVPGLYLLTGTTRDGSFRERVLVQPH